MSTRGMIGFVIDGEAHGTYNHSDSYPSWLGVRILAFGRSLADQMTRDLTIEKARSLKMVDPTENPSPEEAAALAQYTDEHVSTGKDWYSALRHTQGDLRAMLQSGYMIEGTSFADDSLFCEWGYLINFDDSTIEVYKGFQDEYHTDGRFAKKKPANWKPAYKGQNFFYPIRLVQTIALAAIPSDHDFLASLGQIPDEEEAVTA